jgi:hypothetical protein
LTESVVEAETGIDELLHVQVALDLREFEEERTEYLLHLKGEALDICIILGDLAILV